ncbi:DUF4142 domain-containing protein [Flavobacterium daemonense]|uniref:DUF4142 domain-containing protein n=1 Tax=Flavobacterium daemonense TaxID=1393049 RepID=UPI00118643C3|nr:DUF4142 domain-containing protein [Flavobacterium daemonense]KAF2335085.1 DUF4142 domain-containing protein [Flavobacterium daemonense]
MKAMPLIKAAILKVFFLLIVTSFSACGKKEHQKPNSFREEVFSQNNKQQIDKEQVETSFFIAAANVSNALISKSQFAQKRSEIPIQELSKKIEENQNQLLQRISEMANKKLIIITDINVTHKRDLYELIDTDENSFSRTYLNSISESLSEQINLFEKISSETNDEKILKLVLQYLPDQYQLLRETQRLKTEFI